VYLYLWGKGLAKQLDPQFVIVVAKPERNYFLKIKISTLWIENPDCVGDETLKHGIYFSVLVKVKHLIVFLILLRGPQSRGPQSYNNFQNPSPILMEEL
jgi:hypothetical protein